VISPFRSSIAFPRADLAAEFPDRPKDDLFLEHLPRQNELTRLFFDDQG
jgi:hypothetical protein